jgi:hypothetical protein
VVYSQWRLGAHSALGLPSLSDRIVDFVRVTTAADGEASAFLDPDLSTNQNNYYIYLLDWPTVAFSRKKSTHDMMKTLRGRKCRGRADRAFGQA